ncbi:MAG TPA: SCP2 sterol-binding domain-containing protein [Pseudonocardiaceae bacterium]|jgi:putative sterol carrier protein|nr:SCP2 sterol-binding domain-containing protein [Pseudonocardiaceae bacterium]
MTDTDLSAEALGRLDPDRLVALLDGLTPDDPALAVLDINTLGKVVDPKALGRDQFVRLLAALDRLAGLGAHVDLSRMDADTFARIIGRASSDQVRGALARTELRTRILDEIFRRMSDHLRTDRAERVRAVVHWRLTGGTGEGGYDRWETIIEDGTCAVHRESTRDPRVTITVHPLDFLKLITNNASGPVLFMTGKLKIKGDLGFAAGLTSLFDLPKA